MTKTLIRNLKIINGDGQTAAYTGDLLIDGDRIASLGDVTPSDARAAHTTIDGHGKTVMPGFVDTHNHGALGGTQIGSNGIPIACELALRGGITKRICGVDGLSPAPVAPVRALEYAEQLRPLDGHIGAFPWHNTAGFLDWHRGKSITDLGVYLGHSAVRHTIMGNAPRLANDEERRQMCDLVQQEVPHTLGLSTGLVYNPAVYSDQGELTQLLRAYGQKAKAAFFPHLRSESDKILPSLHECLQACVDAGAAYCNEHTKIAGKNNYSKITEMENMLRDGSGSVATMANMYPYTAGSTTGDAVFPPEIRAGSRQAFLNKLTDPQTRIHMHQKIIGDTTSWDNFIYFCGGLEGIQIAGARHSHDYLGKRLGDVARDAGFADLESFGAFEAMFDFFHKNEGDVTIISHYGSELLMERFFRREDMAICTDGLMPAPGAKPHPRSLGAFPKALRMARELGIPIERIAYRMSSLPCAFLQLESPVLRVGGDASLVMLDWETVGECNDYKNPLTPPTGIHKVWVHGQLAFDEGSFPIQTDFPGRILRRAMG